MEQTRTTDPRVARRLALVLEGDREAFLELEEHARSVLRQIVGLQATLAQIRVQQNSFLPALRVPDDVLIAIFSHIVDQEDTTSYAKDLVAVTSVCDRWRAVATAVPGLWTSILPDKPELASLFLSRSGSAPLSIEYLRRDAQMSGPGNLLALVGTRLDQMRSVRIWLYTPEIYGDWANHLSTLSVPALERLSLNMEDRYFADGSPIYVNGLPIFASGTPSLRSLSLRGVVYPPTSPLFSNLRHLSLYRILGTEGYQFRHLLEILSRSPALETLLLGWFDSLDEQHSGLAPVPLSRLREFNIEAVQASALRVIPHLALPDDTTYNLTIRLYASPLEGGPILDHPLVLNRLTSVRYFRQGDFDIISVYREERPTERSNPVLTLNLRHYRSPQFPAVMDAFDFRTVVRLEWESERWVDLGGYHEVQWQMMLKKIPALRTLRIARQWRLMTALTTHVPDDGDRATSCICPALEHLELSEVYTVYYGDPVWPPLRDLASARWDMGSPLKSISVYVVQDGEVDDEVVSAIRERVENFTVHVD